MMGWIKFMYFKNQKQEHGIVKDSLLDGMKWVIVGPHRITEPNV